MRPSLLLGKDLLPCPFRKLYPRVAMVKSAQHGISDDDAAPLDWPTVWSVLVNSEMSPRRVVICGVCLRTCRRCASPQMITWSRHSRRIDPIERSTYPFCHGDRGAMGRSRMPIARSRRVNASPKAPSLSRMRKPGTVSQGKASVIWRASYSAVGQGSAAQEAAGNDQVKSRTKARAPDCAMS